MPGYSIHADPSDHHYPYWVISVQSVFACGVSHYTEYGRHRTNHAGMMGLVLLSRSHPSQEMKDCKTVQVPNSHRLFFVLDSRIIIANTYQDAHLTSKYLPSRSNTNASRPDR